MALRPSHSGSRVLAGTLDIAALKAAQVGSTGAGKVAVFDGSNRLQMAAGSSGTDGVNKTQMEAAIAVAAAASAAGLVNKGQVRSAATVNVASLSGPQTVGGVALIANDKVLLTAQSTGAEDGPWIVNAGAWTRPTNYATGTTQLPNTVWTVSEGDEAESFWWITSDSDVVVDTDAPTIETVPIVGGVGPQGDPGPTGAGYGGTSTTSLLIGAGSKAFTTQAGMAYTVGIRVRAVSAADAANYMDGAVTAYSGTTLTVLVDAVGGSGTLADWNFGPTGSAGAAGATGASYAATSATSFLIGAGSKAFTTQAGLAYVVGSRVRFASAADPANYMEGVVTAYASTTLTALIDAVGGSGTLADWNISIAGNVGAAGASGSGNSPTGWRLFDDMLAPVNASVGLPVDTMTGAQFYCSGAGATAFYNNAMADASHPGVTSMEAGTTTTGYTIWYMGPPAILFGGGEISFEQLIKIEDLATVAQDYIIRWGFGDGFQSDHVDGAYLEYNRSASVNWSMKTASNSARTTTDSGVAVVEDAWIKLKVVVNAAATSVEFFIDGVSVGTIATNIPTGAGRHTSFHGHIVKTAGSTNRIMYVDYVDMILAVTR